MPNRSAWRAFRFFTTPRSGSRSETGAASSCAAYGLLHAGSTSQRGPATALGSAADSEFVHHDELVARHGANQPPLPAIFTVRDGELALLVAELEIDACGDFDALIALLRERTTRLTHDVTRQV